MNLEDFRNEDNKKSLTNILRSNTNLGDYVLKSTLTIPAPNYSYNNYSIKLQKWFCVQDTREPNNQISGDIPYLDLGKTYSSLTICGNDPDYYRIVILDPQILTLIVDEIAGMDVKLAIHRPDDSILLEGTKVASNKGMTIS